MKDFIVMGYPVERDDPDKGDGSGWYISMPVGSEVLEVAFNSGHTIIAEVRQGAKARMRVKHPVLCVQPQQEFPALLGETVGDYLGKCRAMIQGGLVMVWVFKSGVWPTSTLAALDAQGHG